MALVSRPTSTTGAPAPVVLPVDAHGTPAVTCEAPPPWAHSPLTDAPTAPADGRPQTDGGPPNDNHAARAGTEDRGSFTHGTCGDCGWSGPGRRARAVAARDAVRHLQTGCAGRVPTAAAHDHAAR
jgi:hypothetical protein